MTSYILAVGKQQSQAQGRSVCLALSLHDLSYIPPPSGFLKEVGWMISKCPDIFNTSCMIGASLPHRNRNLTQFVSTVLMLCLWKGQH